MAAGQYHELRDLNSIDTAGSAWGTPEKKPIIAVTDAAAVLVSLSCFVVGVVVISPKLSIAWSLQFSGQIVVIGFILSIMNLCMQSILPYAFVLLEARFGRSILQNYEAIVTTKVLTSNSSLAWRAALLFFIGVPLCLSVAYKRFLGGTSTADLTSTVSAAFGIGFPRAGTWAPPNDPIYLFITSISAFLSASQFDPQPYPTENQFPVAYGYNTLLLNNTSAAILDSPTNSTLLEIQDKLHTGETWYMNATVDAYLASRDTRSDFRTNDTTWAAAIASNIKHRMGEMSTLYLYHGMGARLGMMPSGANDEFYFGVYYNSSDWGGFKVYGSFEDHDMQQFRQTAHKYSLKRTGCHGSWQVNTTMILLLDGNCDTAFTADSRIINGPNMVATYSDVLPSGQHVFGNLVKEPNSNGQLESTWLDATYAVSVVTMYWARALTLIYQQGAAFSRYTGSYIPADQQIISTRPTLNAHGLLYLVLAIQPAITTVALGVTIWLHKIPLGKGFGIVSILSGYEPGKSESLVGAGLSGKVSKPIGLQVFPMESDRHALSSEVGDNREGAKIKYRVTGVGNSKNRLRLQKGQVYW